MDMRLASYGNYTLYLVIDKSFISTKSIISLGCDCHPAYVLDALYIRNHSFPFDWLSTTPSMGIHYVNKNIQEGFKYFLDNLAKNERGRVFSSNYVDSEFYHYHDLIENQDTQKTLSRRAQRFIDYYSKKECLFLFNITSEGLSTSKDVSIFVDSVYHFHELSDGKHRLLIYIRYDESFEENETNCEAVIKDLADSTYTRVVRYVQHKSHFGKWGDKSKYPALLRSLGIELRLVQPKVYFRINNRQLRWHKRWQN